MELECQLERRFHASIEFGSNASSFALTGDAVGFQPYQGVTTNEQWITQNSPFTRTINLAGMSFRPADDAKFSVGTQ